VYKVIEINTIKSFGMGSLSFFEAEKDIAFQIRRIYFIYEVEQNVQRGGHAHKTLKQFLFCPYGSVEIILDNGQERKSVMLDEPNKGLIIEPCIWRDMIWLESNSVLCVAASDYYNELDYLRNYDEFIEYIKEHSCNG
jgi:dTDP-4-dehydrorhamnose 3,5-epimerase-like enzyme